jgi:pimeloyl-ACP methyl ester carboxylesterase
MTSRELESRFAANGSVRLHYTVAGIGEALLFVHGIPDFCGGWRYQIDNLSARYCTVAMDLRGFNRSDKPSDALAYKISELINDVVAVIRAIKNHRITLIGHDWGAILGWWVASLYPQMVCRLAALSSPHPLCYLAAHDRGELNYPPQFMEQIVAALPGAPFETSKLSAWVSDTTARQELAQALRRSDAEAIRNYYRVNLPSRLSSAVEVPKVKVPTLIMYGSGDDFIPRRYYDESTNYVAAPCSVVSIPGAGHFIHRETPQAATAELSMWLDEPA